MERSKKTVDINIRNMAADRGVSNYDQPFNNTTSIVYDLPFGKDRRFASGAGALADALIGGWRMTLINTVASGLPVKQFEPAARAPRRRLLI